MYQREISPVIKRLSTLYPIIGITGPRQSGKTTLAKSLFPHLPYVSLENLDIRSRAEQDPRAFLGSYPDGVILDEVQHIPILLSYLQGIVDENPQKGRYVITGSQNFALSSQITQSLPGRIGMVTLLPLSLYELHQSTNIYMDIFNGGYPGLHQQHMQPLDFYPSYIQTYIERDVRQLAEVSNLQDFSRFVRLIAHLTAQEINYSELGRDIGMTPQTAKRWLNILISTFQWVEIPPFHNNHIKRISGKPKGYFIDTGLGCYLTSISTSAPP